MTFLKSLHDGNVCTELHFTTTTENKVVFYSSSLRFWLKLLLYHVHLPINFQATFFAPVRCQVAQKSVTFIFLIVAATCHFNTGCLFRCPWIFQMSHHPVSLFFQQSGPVPCHAVHIWGKHKLVFDQNSRTIRRKYFLHTNMCANMYAKN